MKRVATPDELDRAIRQHGPDDAPNALRRQGLLPPMLGAAGLAIDPSTPAYVFTSSSASSQTTASFTPPAGALLVVMFAAHGSNLQTTPTNTGGTISWASSAKVTKTGEGGAASIWTGTVTASASLTVTGNVTAEADWGLGVVVVTGQAATQNGGTASADAVGDPSAEITSLVGTNSLILGTIANGSNDTLPTIPTGQSDSFNGHTYTGTDASNNKASWCQYLTGMSLAAGSSATINDTAPSVDYCMVIAEILAGATSTPELMLMGVGS